MNEIRMGPIESVLPTRIVERRPKDGRQAAPERKHPRKEARESESARDEAESAPATESENTNPGAIDVLA